MTRTLSPERARLAELYIETSRRATRDVIHRTHMSYVLWRWPCLSWDDAYQVGLEALCNAAYKWNVGGGDFGGWAYRKTWWAVLDWIRAEGPNTRRGVPRYKNFTSLSDIEFAHDFFPESKSLMRNNQLYQDYIDILHARSFINDCMRLLTPREQHVIREHLLRDRRAADIADELQVSEGRVFQIKFNALTKLRRSDGVIYSAET